MFFKAIRVAVLENDCLVREEVKSLLDKEGGMVLVGEARIGDDLFSLLGEHQPDVLILGEYVPQSNEPGARFMNVVVAVQEMVERHPDTALVLLARHHVPLVDEALLVGGVRGFVVRQDRLALELSAAVRTVHRGEAFLSETADRGMFSTVHWLRSPRLTPPQVAVLSAVASSSEISDAEHAEGLGMDVETFRRHLQFAFGVLGVTSRLAAVLRALQLGVLHTEEL